MLKFKYFLLIFLSPLVSIGQSNSGSSIEETDILIQKGISLLNQDLNQSDSLSNIAYYNAIALENDSLIAKSHSFMAYVAYYKGDYKTSIEYYNKALGSDYFKNKLDRRQALLNNLGVNYEFQNNYAEAKEAYQGSLRIAEELGDSLSIYQSYINIGFLNSILYNFRDAEKYLLSALDFFHRQNSKTYEALCLRNLANLYSLEKREEESIKYYILAINKILEFGNEFDALETQIDFNWTLLNLERYTLVKVNQDKIRSIIDKGKASPPITANFHLIEGFYFLDSEKDLKKAEIALNKAFILFKNQGNLRQLSQVIEGRMILYALRGDFTQHRELVSEFLEQLRVTYLNSSTDEIKTLEDIHQLNIQALLIDQLNSKIAFNRTLIIVGIILLILSSGFIFLISRKYMRLNQRNEKTNLKNIELIELIKLIKSSQKNGDSGIKLLAEEVQEEYSMQGSMDENLDQKINAFEKEYDELLFDKINKMFIEGQLFLKADLKVADLAEELFVSEKEISRAISSMTGKRFSSYINEFRIQKAKELLASQHKILIKEVGFKSGFSSQPQFQRKFKELSGMTPEQFRHVSEYQKTNGNS
ncbi:helix-turn-helix domain-containing protein [Belliella aquatica]|uniref:HTH araC/xylS-type domain-containing protein n=1 Tax=Belliella aquatica TaxID=1323734 RepID=A0ABQ1N7N9_9BACT|nr:helix-turn-helix domain-containing protein [Belliella aquatica]MCH7407615.1 helix-turn-helix domain-containing protein [Belliella aquatica]GGC53397.1 hypothetical protein GCM10010993_34790 [Belliella aquatica]